jgi:3-oxoacyl-[acyl-carrier protein] reductase
MNNMGIKKVIKKIIRPTVVYNTVVQNPTAGNLLQGKVAIVTGGSSGLGLEICKAFLAEGATVVMTGRNADKIRRSCEQLNSDRIYGYEWDVKDIRNAKQHILNALGLCKNIENPTLDIFVNNAGTLTAHDWQGDFFAVTEEDFDTVFETNMKYFSFHRRLQNLCYSKRIIRLRKSLMLHQKHHW